MQYERKDRPKATPVYFVNCLTKYRSCKRRILHYVQHDNIKNKYEVRTVGGKDLSAFTFRLFTLQYRDPLDNRLGAYYYADEVKAALVFVAQVGGVVPFAGLYTLRKKDGYLVAQYVH